MNVHRRSGHEHRNRAGTLRADRGARYRFELERRDFLRVFGGGLVVVVAAVPSVPRRNRAAARRRAATPPSLAAWLHIDETGTRHRVHRQDRDRPEHPHVARAGGRRRAARAARRGRDGDGRHRPDAVRPGTFGSQTTPRMAPAAGARGGDRARDADRSGRGRVAGRSRDADARGTAGSSRRTASRLAYGELTKGQKLTGAVAAEPAVTPRGAVERSRHRGRRRWTAAPSSPAAIGTRRISCVRACCTAASSGPTATARTLASIDDCAGAGDGRRHGRARRRLRRRGRADRARGAPRGGRDPARVDAVPAAQPSSATIYDHLKKDPRSARGRRPPSTTGDVAGATAARGRSRRAIAFPTSRTCRSSRAPRSPNGQDGKLTVWTGTQRPFGVRTELAEAFRIPEDRVRVIVPDTGSAYGGKHTGEHAIEAARLAKAAGRPGEAGVDARRGVLVGLLPAGRRHRHQGRASTRRAARGVGVRQLELRRRRHPDAVRRRRTSASRSTRRSRRCGRARIAALAATANHYAREMHMDAIARALGVDAVEFRLRHLKRRADARRADRRGAAPRLAEAVGRRQRALGIACGTEKGSYVATAAEVSPDRRAASRSSASSSPSSAARSSIPDGLRNQVEGAVVQGLGGALFEAIEFANGRILQRDDGAVPRAALQGRAADRDRSCSIARTCRRPAPAKRRSSASRRRSAARRARSARSRRRCRSG